MKHFRKLLKRARRRRGATVVLTVVMLTTLFVCAALAIDVGQICAVAAEQQNTADAGALGGASLLQERRPDEVIADVQKLIARNQRFQGYESIEDQVIELGAWDSVTKKFTALPPDEWESGAFAVRVRAYRSNLQHFFAGIIGRTSTDVSREAVAVGSRDCRGIWGLKGVKAGSISTDSYDSTSGSYDSLTANSNGDICSGGPITINGSAEINGDAMGGFGYPYTVNGNSAQITGLTTSRVDQVPDTEVDIGDSKYNNDNELIGLTDDGRVPFKGTGYHLDIQGTDNLTLAGGTYYFDSITLGGGSSLTITEPTKIYVEGSIDATGGTIVNQDQDPSNLSIISFGSAVKLSGGTNFYGSILAPEADITLSGSGVGLYGAVIGETLELKGDYAIHVDESSWLLGLMPAATPPQLVR